MGLYDSNIDAEDADFIAYDYEMHRRKVQSLKDKIVDKRGKYPSSRDFCDSLEDQLLEKGFLTPKQIEALEAIDGDNYRHYDERDDYYEGFYPDLDFQDTF